MKKLFLLSLIILSVITGCEKDTLSRLQIVNPPPPLILHMNTAPKAFAGIDKTVTTSDTVKLHGAASDADNNIISHSWKKISGPASYKIETSDSVETKVWNMHNGTYEFELTVTDKEGLAGKDTVTITVIQPQIQEGNKQVIFRNLQWIFPWYSSIEVKNVHSYVSPNTPLKVFVQRSFDSTWIEVSPILNSSANVLYEYFIETRPFGAGMYNYGSLYIFYYGPNTSDTPNVKIQF